MVKVTKDGITRFISERELQRFYDWGYKKVELKTHTPEPMIVKPEVSTKSDKK